MTRHFHHRGRWIVFPHYPSAFARFSAETGPEGPTERFWPRRQWGNGFFRYAPRISSDFHDIELGTDEATGLQLRQDGLACESGTGHAVFAFESPYIYCGIPDPVRRVPSVGGAMLSAAFVLPPGTTARIEGAPERSEDWQPLWSSGGLSGEVNCKVDFTPLAEARYRLRLRLVLEGPGTTLKQFETQLWFIVSPQSLPALRSVGANRMRLHSGDAFGLNTRTLMLEHLFNKPESIAAAHAVHNLRHEPDSFSRVLAADTSQPWRMVYELAAPQNGTMAWAAVYTIIEGRRPDEAYDGHTVRIEISDSLEGPWQVIAEKPIMEHPQGWHFGLVRAGPLWRAQEQRLRAVVGEERGAGPSHRRALHACRERYAAHPAGN